MKIGIIGAGFCGLAAAYYLQKKGHTVTIFERDESPGGLAIGYKEDKWKWTLEQHYHHWFTNDKDILDLAKEINYKVIIKRPITSSYVENKIYQFDVDKFNLKVLKEISGDNVFGKYDGMGGGFYTDATVEGNFIKYYIYKKSEVVGDKDGKLIESGTLEIK